MSQSNNITTGRIIAVLAVIATIVTIVGYFQNLLTSAANSPATNSTIEHSVRKIDDRLIQINEQSSKDFKDLKGAVLSLKDTGNNNNSIVMPQNDNTSKRIDSISKELDERKTPPVLDAKSEEYQPIKKNVRPEPSFILSGYFEGQFTNPEFGCNWAIRIHFESIGNSLKGDFIINGNDYQKRTFTGLIFNNSVSLNASDPYEIKMEFGSPCRGISFSLVGQEDYLEGTWTAASCRGGQVVLVKI